MRTEDPLPLPPAGAAASARGRQAPAANRALLVSDPAHFRVDYVINPYMDPRVQPDPSAAAAEHEAIVQAHLAAGRKVERIASAPGCPDMVFIANAAVVGGGCAVMGSPPPERRQEIPWVREWLAARGYRVVDAPYAFSGQGDALWFGPALLAGHGWRTDRRMHPVLARDLGCRVVPLRTVSDWWYDLDLAVGVVDDRTLAYCPQALDAPSAGRLRELGADLIEVTEAEARGFALNFVSDGATVTITRGAPRLAAELAGRGLRVIELGTAELMKGGGGVRCTALTLGSR